MADALSRVDIKEMIELSPVKSLDCKEKNVMAVTTRAMTRKQANLKKNKTENENKEDTVEIEEPHP